MGLMNLNHRFEIKFINYKHCDGSSYRLQPILDF